MDARSPLVPGSEGTIELHRWSELPRTDGESWADKPTVRMPQSSRGTSDADSNRRASARRRSESLREDALRAALLPFSAIADHLKGD